MYTHVCQVVISAMKKIDNIRIRGQRVKEVGGKLVIKDCQEKPF